MPRVSILALLALVTSACAAVHEARPDARDPSPRSDAAPPPPLPASTEEGGDDLPPGVETHTMSVPVEGTDLVRGRSTVTVAAPIERVREGILDFSHYPEFMPHYSKCRMLGRTATGGRDVYMEVEALHGAVKMWARIEIAKPVTTDGVETHNTRFLEGNVKDFQAVWSLKKIDEGHTDLSLEVFLHPSLPLPSKLLNEQNLEKSAMGVLAMRTRIERGEAK